MIKSIWDNYRFEIVKTTKKSLVLDYGLSNATFEPPNHVFTPINVIMNDSSQLNKF
jgi:hypothetical protein